MIFFNNFGKKADGFAYCLVFKGGKISEGFFNFVPTKNLVQIQAV